MYRTVEKFGFFCGRVVYFFFLCAVLVGLILFVQGLSSNPSSSSSSSPLKASSSEVGGFSSSSVGALLPYRPFSVFILSLSAFFLAAALAVSVSVSPPPPSGGVTSLSPLGASTSAGAVGRLTSSLSSSMASVTLGAFDGVTAVTLGIPRPPPVALAMFLLFLNGDVARGEPVVVTPWFRRELWVLGQVADIVVGFVGGKFVAVCELPLEMPGLIANQGGLVGGWVAGWLGDWVTG